MRTKYTYELALKLKEEYDKGASQSELDVKYHLNSRQLFKKFNLKCRKPWETQELVRKNRIKLSWNFDKIELEWHAYILGFLLSDGYQNGSQIGFAQSIKDVDYITKLRDLFSKDIKLSFWKTKCSFKVSSKIACENLSKLGVTPRKTYKELSIPLMEEHLLRHFIRGYFDGDGTIFVCTVKGIPKYMKGNICSPTENILKELQSVLLKFGIESTINKENRKGKIMHTPSGPCLVTQDMYRLYFRKKDSIRKLYNFLYKDATIFMERKKKVFDDNYFLW